MCLHFAFPEIPSRRRPVSGSLFALEEVVDQVAAAGPPVYPEVIAQSERTAVLSEMASKTVVPRIKDWSMVRRSRLYENPPPGFARFLEPAVLEAQVHQCWDDEPNPLDRPCGYHVMFGVCERCGKRHAKALECSREWCIGYCGGLNGPAHQRRKAQWLPKYRMMGDMRCFVLTMPAYLREEYVTREALRKLGKAAKRMFKKLLGYRRGLRRWHFFGEPDQHLARGDRPPYNPHLEVFVDGGYMKDRDLDRLRNAWSDVLGIPHEHGNIHHRYIKREEVQEKMHRLSYATRPTFLDWHWFPELARELHGQGFRNMSHWGSPKEWAGEPVWDVPEDPEAEVLPPELVLAQSGLCSDPKCGGKIRWLGIMESRELPPGFKYIGAGYLVEERALEDTA